MCKNQIRSIIESIYIIIVSEIPHLLIFKASNNQIETLNGLQDSNKLKHLQILLLNSNKIKELIPINLIHLKHLNLSDNEIASCEKFAGSNSLELLELRKNKLKNLKGLENMPMLTELYIAENELTTIDGLKNIPSLKRLHLRKNAMVKLQPIPVLPSLEYLNIRENPIENSKELINLKMLNTLKRISLKGTPPGDEFGDGAKKELIILLGEYVRFQVVNKAEITKEDIAEANEEKKERKKKEEESKIEAERIAKEQAEQKKEEEVKA